MTSEPSAICPQCGRKIRGGADCDHCARAKVFRLVHREIVLLLFLAVASIGAYFGTLAFAMANHRMMDRLALSFYQEGKRLLQANHPDQAVAAFRKAAVNDRGNFLYELALVRALESDNRDKEASQLLLQLREASPEDPEINVELGRISVRENNVNDAIRYYHNALYGIWTGDQADPRRTQVRRELIEFLIGQHAKDQALAEILALAAHLDNTPASNLELGALFLRVGDPRRALAEFRLALREEPHNQAALQGAGKASFLIGDYAQAHRFLSAMAAPDADSRNMLELATQVLASDPLAPRVAEKERHRRLLADFDRATQRVADCLAGQASGTPLISIQDKLRAEQATLTPAHLKSNPNLVFDALELIYQAEDTASKFCGQAQGIDLALLLIGQKSRRAEP